METAPEQGGGKPVKILVFACRWCGGIGAERAGWKRMDLPASFRVIPVECAALVEPDAVFRALASGIDGVAVLGCHVGGCRYDEANHAALKRMELLKVLLDTAGIGGERLCLAFGPPTRITSSPRSWETFTGFSRECLPWPHGPAAGTKIPPGALEHEGNQGHVPGSAGKAGGRRGPRPEAGSI
jgi:F420-non-reducing hydrogenase iron-sulfur subunit